ncbi:MAG TPA: FHA domain-containing protein [Myxococcales bacterium]
MARLIFRNSDGQERTYELDAELKVGSAAGNDVVLADPAVAERHCRFFADDQGKVWMEGLAGTAAKSEVLPDSEIALGEWKARLERPLVLEVVSAGELHGKTFPLAKDRLVVGSGPASDLCLVHESVSARHAQISRIGGRLNLLDLGSTQGTFVDGERVGSTQIATSDRLRFGTVELVFAGFVQQPLQGAEPRRPEEPVAPRADPPAPVDDSAPPPAAAQRSRTPLLIAASAIALAGASFFATSIPEPPPVASTEPRPIPVPKADPDEHLTQCTSLCTPEDPAFDAPTCLRKCRDLMDAHPSLGGHDSAKRAEQLAPGYLAYAADLVAEGRPDLALSLLRYVGPESSSFAKAKELYRSASLMAAEEPKKECRTVVAGGLFEQAVNGSCRRVLELTCGLPGGPDPGALVRFRHAARSLGRDRAPWTCPATQFTQPFDASQAGDGGDPAETLIRDRYPNPRLAEIMVEYYRSGDATEALASLKAAEGDLPAPERTVAKDAAKPLDLLRLRLVGLRGISNLVFIEQIRQAESRFLPLGVNSPIVRNADRSKGSAQVQPSHPTGDAKICSGVKAAYDRSRPGSKERGRTVDYARQAGCGSFLPPNSGAR